MWPSIDGELRILVTSNWKDSSWTSTTHNHVKNQLPVPLLTWQLAAVPGPSPPFFGSTFFCWKKRVFRWMWSSFLRCSTYNKGFQEGLICTTQRVLLSAFFWGSRWQDFHFATYPQLQCQATRTTGAGGLGSRMATKSWKTVIRLPYHAARPIKVCKQKAPWTKVSRRLGGLCVLVDV